MVAEILEKSDVKALKSTGVEEFSWVKSPREDDLFLLVQNSKEQRFQFKYSS